MSYNIGSMIRYRLSELIAERKFQEGGRVKIGDLAEATGIHRATLSKLINQPGTNTTTDVLERLCVYFGVSIGELVEVVPDKKPGRRKGR